MFWLIIFGTFLLILSVASPFFGIITYIGILYLRPQEVYLFLAPYHIPRVFAIAIIFGFLLRYAKEKKVFFNYKQDKILFALLIVIMLSFTVGWIPKCLEVWEQMAKNIIIYGLIVGMVNSEKRLKVLIWMLLIMSAILGFNTIQEYKALDPRALSYMRLGGFSGGYFAGAGDFAIMMNIVIPFAFFLGIFGNPLILRPLALWFVYIFIFAIIATNQRGGVIAFGGVILGLAYFGSKSKGFFKKSLSIALLIASIAGIIAFSPAAFKQRASTILDYQNQDTAVNRIEFWKLGIKMFLSSPLLGVGAGNYPLRYWDFGGWEQAWRVPHNMYIEALSELGILGFSCLFFLLYFTFKDGFSTIRILKQNNKTGSFLYSVNQAAIVSLFTYCVGGMFQSLFTYPMLYILIAILVSIRAVAGQALVRESC